MSTNDFFVAVSSAVSGNTIEIIILLLSVIAIIGGLFYVYILKPWQIRNRREKSFNAFLHKRHNLTQKERSALKQAAAKQGISPYYLVLISRPAFDEIDESLRHILNSSEQVKTISCKLFQ
jgi:FtsZ-interacting cell division protein ZipA